MQKLLRLGLFVFVTFTLLILVQCGTPPPKSADPTSSPPTPSPTLPVIGWEQVDLPFARVNVLSDKPIRAMAVDPKTPSTLYASAGADGVYKTLDSGSTWTSMDLPVKDVVALVIDPQNPQTLYLSTVGWGIFKSIDGGQTWAPASTGIEDQTVSSLAVAPQQSQVLYAGVEDKGLWRSDDGAQNWLQVSATLTHSETLTGTHTVIAVVVDPQNSQHIYVSVRDKMEIEDETMTEGRFVQSWDGGQSWELVRDEEPRAIAVSPQISSYVFASFVDGSLWRSGNQGTRWKPVGSLENCNTLLADPFSIETLYAGTDEGIYRSVDGGETWQSTGQKEGRFLALAVDPGVPNVVYAGAAGEDQSTASPGGVLKTLDGGASWFPITYGAGISDQPVDVFSLLSDPRDPNALLVSTSQGCYRSLDGGQSWEPALAGLALAEVRALTLASPSEGAVWYAAAQGSVLRSDDGGRNWAWVSEKLADVEVNALVTHTSDPQAPAPLLYMGTSGGVFKYISEETDWALSSPFVSNVYALYDGQALYAGSSDGLYYSSDNGRTWEEVSTTGPVYDLAQGKDGAIYAASSKGLYRYSGSAYQSEQLSFRDTRAIWLDPGNVSRIYVGTAHGVMSSRDRGQSWEESLLPGSPVRSLRAITSTQTLYALTGSGLFRTTMLSEADEIDHIGDMPSGDAIRWSAPVVFSHEVVLSQEYFNVFSLLAFGGQLYAGTEDGGIFISQDEGGHWQAVGEGVSGHVRSLWEIGGKLYAGTSLGLFLSDDGGGQWISGEGLAVKDVQTLLAYEGWLYAGVQRSGVFTSADGGETWQPAGLLNQDVQSLLAYEGHLYAGTDEGIFVSQDKGRQWQSSDSGLADQSVQSLLAYEGYLYAGTDDGGVFISQDKGQQWQPINTGLTNQNVQALLAYEGHLYARTAEGVFVSQAGENWVSIGLTDQNVQALLAYEGHLYAGVAGGVVFVSEDGGGQWQSKSTNTGLADPNVRALVASERKVYVGTGSGVFVSEDEGKRWYPANVGLENLNVLSLLTFDGHLYAGTYGEGVFVSRDAGKHWISTELNDQRVRSLAVFDGHLYACTDEGIFVSQDKGNRWHERSRSFQVGGTSYVGYLVWSLLASEGQLYAGTRIGVFVSQDMGKQWRLAKEGLTNTNVQSLMFWGGRLYAGTNGGGVFVSQDGGETWQSANTGLTNDDVHALMVFERRLYAGTEGGGVFISQDGGETWQSANVGLTHKDVRSLMAFEGQLYAGTNGGGVFVSLDGGKTWQSRSGSIFRREWKETRRTPIRALSPPTTEGGPPCIGTQGQGAVCVLPEGSGNIASGEVITSSRLYVQDLVSDGEQLYAATLDGLFESAWGGNLSWQAVPISSTHRSVQALALNRQFIYIVTWDQKLLRSTNGQDEWVALTTLPGLYTYQVLTGPGTDWLWAVTDAGAYRSEDGGQSWQVCSGTLPTRSVRDLAVTQSLTHTLYAATSAALFKSEDSGATWRQCFSGHFASIAVDPLMPQIVYAAADGQLLLSSDGGSSWEQVPLPDNVMVDLVTIGGGDPNALWAAHRADGQIIRGTLDRTVFAYESLERGHRASEINDHQEALESYQQALDMFTAAGDPGGQAEANYQLGQTYAAQGNHKTAVRYYQAAPLSYEDQIDRLMAVGESYAALQSLDLAIEQYKRAMALNPNAEQVAHALGRAYCARAEDRLAQRNLVAWWNDLGEGEKLGACERLPLERWLGLLVMLIVIMALGGFVILARSSGLPSRVLLKQGLSLIPVGLQYRAYRQRWESGAPLERLIVLLMPDKGSTESEQLSQTLSAMSVPVDAEQLKTALNMTVRDGLLLRKDGDYRLIELRLARALQAHEGQAGQAALTDQIRREHPLCASAERFFTQADFELTQVATETLLYRCEVSADDLQRLLGTSVVYVRFLPGEELSADQANAIHEQVRQIDTQASVVFAVTNRCPTDKGWAQIGVLQMGGFTILPIESTLIYEGLASENERALLLAEIEERLGDDYDPYDVRSPVADVFSFFGRDALMEEIWRSMAEGRPVGIFGLRKMGKTSLLEALRHRAPFPIAVVNLQTFDRQTLADDLYAHILRRWREQVRILYKQVAWEPPPISSMSPAGTFRNATLDLLSQLQRQEGKAQLGVLLDEVELIVPQPDGSGPDLQRYLRLLRALRGLIDVDKRLSLVVSSLNPSINRINAWGGEQNPTFNLFREIYLPPLAEEDCIRMVRNIGRQIGLVYTDESLHTISALSGGHPFLARQLCSMLYKRHGRQEKPIEEDDVQDGARQFIYDEQTVTHLNAGIWQDVGNQDLWGHEGAQVNQALLLDIARADGPVRRDALLRYPERGEEFTGARQAALINLERFQIIYQPQPDVYAIRFGLLHTWLRRRRLGLE